MKINAAHGNMQTKTKLLLNIIQLIYHTSHYVYFIKLGIFPIPSLPQLLTCKLYLT